VRPRTGIHGMAQHGPSLSSDARAANFKSGASTTATTPIGPVLGSFMMRNASNQAQSETSPPMPKPTNG